jgi:SET domain-containing protein
MKNSCVPNTYSTFSVAGAAEHELIVRASRDIKKGEPVTRCLSDVMKCNLFR